MAGTQENKFIHAYILDVVKYRSDKESNPSIASDKDV
jgi:hypothetical protein